MQRANKLNKLLTFSADSFSNSELLKLHLCPWNWKMHLICERANFFQLLWNICWKYWIVKNEKSVEKVFFLLLLHVKTAMEVAKFMANGKFSGYKA